MLALSDLKDSGRRFALSSPPRVAGVGGQAGEPTRSEGEGFSPGGSGSTLEGHLMAVWMCKGGVALGRPAQLVVFCGWRALLLVHSTVSADLR